MVLRSSAGSGTSVLHWADTGELRGSQTRFMVEGDLDGVVGNVRIRKLVVIERRSR